jgi:hypothetical protein
LPTPNQSLSRCKIIKEEKRDRCGCPYERATYAKDNIAIRSTQLFGAILYFLLPTRLSADGREIISRKGE